MFCWDVPVADDAFLDNIKPCSEHGNESYFICLDENCEKRCLLCAACISGDHRDHKWESIENLLTPEIRNVIKTGTSDLGKEVRLATIAMLDFYKTFSEKIKSRLDVVYEQSSQWKFQVQWTGHG